MLRSVTLLNTACLGASHSSFSLQMCLYASQNLSSADSDKGNVRGKLLDSSTQAYRNRCGNTFDSCHLPSSRLRSRIQRIFFLQVLSFIHIYLSQESKCNRWSFNGPL